MLGLSIVCSSIYSVYLSVCVCVCVPIICRTQMLITHREALNCWVDFGVEIPEDVRQPAQLVRQQCNSRFVKNDADLIPQRYWLESGQVWEISLAAGNANSSLESRFVARAKPRVNKSAKEQPRRLLVDKNFPKRISPRFQETIPANGTKLRRR